MRITFIGTGNVASTLSKPLSQAGHHIIWGSRDPADKNTDYPVLSHRDAIDAADVVVNATPGAVSLEVFRSIGASALAGKVLLDLANALAPDFTLVYPNSSLAEQLQTELPLSHVVKSANTAAIDVVANPELLKERGHLFVSGDNQEAKQTITSLLADLGWRDAVIDLGDLTTARSTEAYFPLFFTLVRSTGNPHLNIAVVG